MPITFTPSESLELVRYGKFCLLHFTGEIDAADAVTIVSTPMPPTIPPAVTAIYTIRTGWGVVTERFNWGETTRPDDVYYELWSTGVPEGLRPLPKVTEAEALTGFYCGNKIAGSNLDNRCTHIVSSERIYVKLWNCSSPAKDVFYDFSVWYYTFPLDYLKYVQSLFRKKGGDNVVGKMQLELLQEISDKLSRRS